MRNRIFIVFCIACFVGAMTFLVVRTSHPPVITASDAALDASPLDASAWDGEVARPQRLIFASNFLDAAIDPNNCGDAGGVCGHWVCETSRTCHFVQDSCALGACEGGTLCNNVVGCCETNTNVPIQLGYAVCPNTFYCVNVLSDSANCGTCAHACIPGQFCNFGQCR